MNTKIKKYTFGLAVCFVVASFSPLLGAEQSNPVVTEASGDQAERLFKDYKSAELKFKEAKRVLDQGGYRVPALGFEKARDRRDKLANTVSKLEAYARYAEATKYLSEKTRREVERGALPVVCLDIARYEHLHAEVELARVSGRLVTE